VDGDPCLENVRSYETVMYEYLGCQVNIVSELASQPHKKQKQCSERSVLGELNKGALYSLILSKKN